MPSGKGISGLLKKETRGTRENTRKQQLNGTGNFGGTSKPQP